MGFGIVICGLNGCGKSTLGRALAEKIAYHFIDIEDLYFTRTSEESPYTNARSREEVIELLLNEVQINKNFVFATVKGDYGNDISQFYKCVVLIRVPKDIRMQRVRNRSFQKFGDRMLEDGDLHESEEHFFRLVESRAEEYAEKWLRSLQCPVIIADGTKPVEENISLILGQISALHPHCSVQ